MTRTRRIVAALVASAALAAPTTLITAAEAKPASTGAKSQAKQLLKDIAREDRQLAKLATSHTVTALADDTEAMLVAHIADDRATLVDLRSEVEAADSTLDTKAARKEFRSFRFQNLKQAAHVLKKVEELTAAAAADPEAQAFLDQAEAAALELSSTSTKDEVHAAKAFVAAAEAELGVTDSDDSGM